MLKKHYVEKLEMELSPLGEGVMRFPMHSNTYLEDALRFMEIAMSEGINYYDTAFNYIGSEELIRQALVEKYDRNSFIIADKLPVWLCNSRLDMEQIFSTQLERLGVEYIDIYLLHAMNKDRWLQVYENGVLDFLIEKKREGRIRKTGFSFHDKAENFPLLVNAHDWDMVQLQINYYDWIVHDVKRCYELLREKDIPIVVMEPVGGGRLARLPGTVEEGLRKLDPDRSIPSWAIRFCASLPGVEVVLSGMSTEAELRDNLSCFNPFVSLSDIDIEALEDCVKVIQRAGAIPCSACRYCTEDCPVGIDIPYIFQQYNDSITFENPFLMSWTYLDIVPPARRADKCINCGKCSKMCPQKIEIPELLDFVHMHVYKVAAGFVSNEEFEKALNDGRGKTVILFGAGMIGKSLLPFLKTKGLQVSYFCDNGEHLWNTDVEGVEVISPIRLTEINEEKSIWVLISNPKAHNAIKKQLSDIGITSVN